MDGLRYSPDDPYSNTSRVFDYVSDSQCATGPAREGEVYLEWPQMEKPTKNAPINSIRLLPGGSAPVGVINTAAARGGNGSHSRGVGGGGFVRKDTFPLKKQKKPVYTSIHTYTYQYYIRTYLIHTYMHTYIRTYIYMYIYIYIHIYMIYVYIYIRIYIYMYI